MTETFTNKDDSKRSVVLVEYPRKGTWAVGFATKKNETEISSKTNKNLINVFLPTTPNPTSGFMLFVPKKDLIRLNMNIEEGMKLVISGGIITPPVRKKSNIIRRK